MRPELLLTKPDATCLGIGLTVSIFALTGLMISLFALWSLSCLGGSTLTIASQMV